MERVLDAARSNPPNMWVLRGIMWTCTYCFGVVPSGSKVSRAAGQERPGDGNGSWARVAGQRRLDGGRAMAAALLAR